MEIKRGTSRIVILAPMLGLVFKAPRIHVRIFLGAVKSCWKHRGRKRLRMELFEFDVESFHSIKWALFKGLVDNWREWRFFRQTRHPFLQPTHCSFFGLLNIQRMGRRQPVWGKLYAGLDARFNAICGRDVWKSPHTFCNPGNFCVEDGKLKIVDYASSRVQAIVLKYGTALMESFAPTT